MGKWWASLDRSRFLLLGALVVMTLAEFAEAIKPVYRTIYYGRASRYSVPNAGVADTRVIHAGYSGWEVHPVAPLVLGLLAFLFISNFSFGPGYLRYRYWLACAALVACLTPSTQAGESSNTVVIGILALIIAASAALFRKTAT